MINLGSFSDELAFVGRPCRIFPDDSFSLLLAEVKQRIEFTWDGSGALCPSDNCRCSSGLEFSPLNAAAVYGETAVGDRDPRLV